MGKEPQSQIDTFHEAARELEIDDEPFDAALKADREGATAEG
jgi:hypothetical protein